MFLYIATFVAFFNYLFKNIMRTFHVKIINLPCTNCTLKLKPVATTIIFIGEDLAILSFWSILELLVSIVIIISDSYKLFSVLLIDV